MPIIKYLKGDATSPITIEPNAPIIIAHVCNNTGSWGAGFVIPLGDKYPKAKNNYINKNNYILGNVDIVKINNNLFVANMIAQDNNALRFFKLDYNALIISLINLNYYALTNFNHQPKPTIHAPKFGSGIANGNWNVIESIINNFLTDVDVYIYELN